MVKILSFYYQVQIDASKYFLLIVAYHQVIESFVVHFTSMAENILSTEAVDTRSINASAMRR